MLKDFFFLDVKETVNYDLNYTFMKLIRETFKTIDAKKIPVQKLRFLFDV